MLTNVRDCLAPDEGGIHMSVFDILRLVFEISIVALLALGIVYEKKLIAIEDEIAYIVKVLYKRHRAKVSKKQQEKRRAIEIQRRRAAQAAYERRVKNGAACGQLSVPDIVA